MSPAVAIGLCSLCCLPAPVPDSLALNSKNPAGEAGFLSSGGPGQTTDDRLTRSDSSLAAWKIAGTNPDVESHVRVLDSRLPHRDLCGFYPAGFEAGHAANRIRSTATTRDGETKTSIP